MKRGFLLIGVFILFSFSFVMADIDGDCHDSQVIMKLYSATNSHGELWNGTGYDYKICHDDVFGFDNTLSNPHACTGENRIVSMTGITNAHVFDTHDADHPVDICYGNLKCQHRTGSCEAGEKIVARLLGTHLSNSEDTSYTGLVCCTSASVYWADMNGNKVYTAEPEDTVQLMAKGLGVVSDFNIKEDDVIDDDIKTITGESIDGELSSLATWEIELIDLS